MNLIKKLAVVAMILFLSGVQNSYTADIGGGWRNNPDRKNLRTDEQLRNRINFLRGEVREIEEAARKSELYDAISDELQKINSDLSRYKKMNDEGIEVLYAPGLSDLTITVKNLKEAVGGKEKGRRGSKTSSMYSQEPGYVLE